MKVISKMSGCKHLRLGCKKTLVVFTKLDAKFVLRIHQLDYMVMQSSFLMQMVPKHKESLLKDTPISFLKRTEFNKVEALDKGSVSFKNEIGVSFGKLSLCLVPSA